MREMSGNFSERQSLGNFYGKCRRMFCNFLEGEFPRGICEKSKCTGDFLGVIIPKIACGCLQGNSRGD